MRLSRVLDEMLVMQCQRGDEKAFRVLVKRWHTRILRFATKVTNDKAAAHDIAQESWQAIIKNLKNLKDPARFSTWVYRITNNKSVDWIRKNQRARNAIQEFKNENVIIDDADDTDKLKIVTESLKQLPQNQKIILTLFYLEEQSLRQIGEILKLPLGTVKSRLFHAREHLKKLIREVKNETVH